MQTKYRIRRGFLGKSILQRWHCYPDGILSSLAGSCEWIDVDFDNAPTDLREIEK